MAWDNGGTSHRGNRNKGTIQTWVATLKPTGADGTATARCDFALKGGVNSVLGGGIQGRNHSARLMGIAIEVGGQPATIDLTLEELGTDTTLAVFTDVAADVAPSLFVSDAITDDGAVSADIGGGLVFQGGISVELAQGDVFVSSTEDAPCVVTLWVQR